MTTEFVRLNGDWNAEPNVPEPRVVVTGADLRLTFYFNAFQFPHFEEGDIGQLRFKNCWRYRLGPPNDEGWMRGQSRFSAPPHEWGHFYEVRGDVLEESEDDWQLLAEPVSESKHFLFYFRDETFECDAHEWSLEVKPV